MACNSFCRFLDFSFHGLSAFPLLYRTFSWIIFSALDTLWLMTACGVFFLSSFRHLLPPYLTFLCLLSLIILIGAPLYNTSFYSFFLRFSLPFSILYTSHPTFSICLHFSLSFFLYFSQAFFTLFQPFSAILHLDLDLYLIERVVFSTTFWYIYIFTLAVSLFVYFSLLCTLSTLL